MEEYDFRLDFSVRDYECDMQGVVNNAVYQNYLEHARHEYLKTLGLDFVALTERKINLVVIRAELDYKKSLRGGDRFWVSIRVERISALRFAFHQDVFRHPDDVPVLRARIVGTALSEKGRPKMPPEIALALAARDGAGR